MTVLDWPGHGWSDDDSEPASVVRYGQLLAAFIEKQQLGKVVLIGNSIGGGAAIHYAHAAPAKVAALVLANPAGLIEMTPRNRRAVLIMARFFSAGIKRRWWFTPAFALYYRLVLPRASGPSTPPRHCRRALRERPDAGAGLAEFCRSVVRLAIRCRRPVMPGAVHLGDARPLRPLRSLPRGYRGGALTLTVEKFDAGHSPFLETPDAFMASLKRFLERPN